MKKMGSLRASILAAVVLSGSVNAWATNNFQGVLNRFGVTASPATSTKPCLCVGGLYDETVGVLVAFQPGSVPGPYVYECFLPLFDAQGPNRWRRGLHPKRRQLGRRAVQVADVRPRPDAAALTCDGAPRAAVFAPVAALIVGGVWLWAYARYRTPASKDERGKDSDAGVDLMRVVVWPLLVAFVLWRLERPLADLCDARTARERGRAGPP